MYLTWILFSGYTLLRVLHGTSVPVIDTFGRYTWLRVIHAISVPDVDALQ